MTPLNRSVTSYLVMTAVVVAVPLAVTVASLHKFSSCLFLGQVSALPSRGCARLDHSTDYGAGRHCGSVDDPECL